MTEKKFGVSWAKKYAVKSVLLFLLHFLILLLIMAAALLFKQVSNLKAYMKEYGPDYLYALFCIFLLMMITYLYFLFEDKQILESSKHIALVFTVLELYFLLSWVIGEYIHVYARPIALAGLLVFVLIGRRNAIFMNVVCSLLIFLSDSFLGMGGDGARQIYSSLIIAFSAGMLAIFLCERAKTRLSIVWIGILIVIPIDLIIILLELSSLIEGNVTEGLSQFQPILIKMGYGLAGGVLSAVIFLFFLPLLEGIFNRLTVFRLRELTSSDAKILQKLKEEAPGAYNH